MHLASRGRALCSCHAHRHTLLRDDRSQAARLVISVAMVASAAAIAAPKINAAKPGRCRVCREWYPSRQQVTKCLRTHGIKLAPAKAGQPARRKRSGLRAAAREQHKKASAAITGGTPRASSATPELSFGAKPHTHSSTHQQLPRHEDLRNVARMRELNDQLEQLRADIAAREAAPGRRPA